MHINSFKLSITLSQSIVNYLFRTNIRYLQQINLNRFSQLLLRTLKLQNTQNHKLLLTIQIQVIIDCYLGECTLYFMYINNNFTYSV